jgi:hypothetical protein
MEFDINELINNQEGLLPISGGIGNSINNPIIINAGTADYVSVEYEVLARIFKLFGKKWEIAKQELMEKDGRSYDKFGIIFNGESGVLHNHYFDVTDCI